MRRIRRPRHWRFDIDVEAQLDFDRFGPSEQLVGRAYQLGNRQALLRLRDERLK
jgi:hypothetical protein